MRNRTEDRMICNLDREAAQKAAFVPQPKVERVRSIHTSQSEVDFKTFTVRGFAQTFDFGAAIRREMQKAGIR